MNMRLQKVLAQAGIASRRKAEEMIAAGRVEVNGEVVRAQGTQVDASRDLVRVDGRLLELERKVYFVLYKPPEVVTTLSDPQGRTTIASFLAAVPERVFAVGRLDYDAEGALIVTNDGALAHRLMHPSFGVPRVYLAKVKGVPDESVLDLARRGLRLEDGPVKPLDIERGESVEKNTWLKIVLAEGRPHLVKRLCAAMGHPVLRLYRPLYGGVSAEGLRPGELRALTSAEISLLKNGGRSPVPKIADIKAPPRRHRAIEREAVEVESQADNRSRPQRANEAERARAKPKNAARPARSTPSSPKGRTWREEPPHPRSDRRPSSGRFSDERFARQAAPRARSTAAPNPASKAPPSSRGSRGRPAQPQSPRSFQPALPMSARFDRPPMAPRSAAAQKRVERPSSRGRVDARAQSTRSRPKR